MQKLNHELNKQQIHLTTSKEKVKNSIVKSKEKRILEIKAKSIPIGRMSDDEQRLTVYRLLFNINAITGWQMPEAEIADLLIEQLQVKILESYPYLNPHEITYAFRNNSVKEFGKNFNLFTFDEVIQIYLQSRKEAERIDEQEKLNQTLNLPMPEITKEEKLKTIEEYCKRDDISLKNLYLIPAFLYNDIVKLGLYSFTREEKQKLYDKATLYKLNEMKERAKNDLNYNKYYQRFKEHFEKGWFEDEEIEQIHYIYLKIAFLYYKNLRNASAR